MSIKIESTTDTPEQVMSVMAGVKTEVNADETKETNSASEEVEETETDETAEESETSEDTKEGEEDSESKDGDEDDDDEEKEEEKPKKKNGFKKRIDSLRKRVSDKDREIEYWREQALKGQPREREPQAKTAESKAETGKPSPDDFDSHDEYIEALSDWKVEQKLKAHEEKQRVLQAQTEFQKAIQAHNKRVEAFVKTHDDFHEVVEDVDDIPLSIAIQEVILSSENGPELMYSLAKNREELERINALSPIAAARELGKFEAKIKAQSESRPKKKTTTKAPKPLSAIGGKSGGSVKKSIYDPNLSYKEYERLRAEQERQRA